MSHPSILTNIHAQNAQAGIKTSLANLKTTSIRTATGKQITEAKDGPASLSIGIGPVSYTHLDVYKRQFTAWSICLLNYNMN